MLIRTGQVTHALPVLEALLGSFGARPSGVVDRSGLEPDRVPAPA